MLTHKDTQVSVLDMFSTLFKESLQVELLKEFGRLAPRVVVDKKDLTKFRVVIVEGSPGRPGLSLLMDRCDAIAPYKEIIEVIHKYYLAFLESACDSVEKP